MIHLEDLDRKGARDLQYLIKLYADRYPQTGEYKGAFINLQHHMFFITSNLTFEELFGPNKDADQNQFYMDTQQKTYEALLDRF